MGILDNAKNKANEFLNSDSGERKSDELLDKAADAAKRKLGADKADKVDRVRDAIDERIGGGDNNTRPGQPHDADANTEPDHGTAPGAAPGNA
ncbi:hypothetical protein CFAEC_04295 [Corynebacterium faecale]|uniref:antitoxin n=1 Tax=Corynebacterium faecale TaxID=1758466 RepID=UPI0025B41290|nr:antitoxin [Corynebacterium faecale]WJY91706.1 hypothetical protein CFAEC_04295 [Corynebacterium faecale]